MSITQPKYLAPSSRVKLEVFNESELDIVRHLGNGTTSSVNLARRYGLLVAVKTLKNAEDVNDVSTRRRMKSDFENELSINLNLRHPNIIMLLGCIMSPRSSTSLKSLVFEYCSGGTLACKSFGLSKMSDALKISIGIARALCHAHALGIIHRDVKPSQVVLSKVDDGEDRNGEGRSSDFDLRELIPKLGDWGLSVRAEDTQSLTGETGTLEFMAPEVIRNDKYSTSADVFSFGIFLYCITTGEDYPYGGHYLTPVQAAQGVVKHNLRPKLSSRMPITVSQIMKMCWSESSATRPTMDVVIAMLENALYVETQVQRKRSIAVDNSTSRPQSSGFYGWMWGSAVQVKTDSRSATSDQAQSEEIDMHADEDVIEKEIMGTKSSNVPD